MVGMLLCARQEGWATEFKELWSCHRVQPSETEGCRVFRDWENLGCRPLTRQRGNQNGFDVMIQSSGTGHAITCENEKAGGKGDKGKQKKPLFEYLASLLRAVPCRS